MSRAETWPASHGRLQPEILLVSQELDSLKEVGRGQGSDRCDTGYIGAAEHTARRLAPRQRCVYFRAGKKVERSCCLRSFLWSHSVTDVHNTVHPGQRSVSTVQGPR